MDLEGEKRTPHAARFLGRVEVPLFHLGVPFRLVFDSDASSYPKNRQYIPPFVDLIPHREFSHDLCFVYSVCQVFQAMTSGDSYQCTSMDDDDDELEGNSPTSIHRRNRKRKDYSDDEDVELREIMDEEPDEEDDEAIFDIPPLATAPPSPIPVAGVRVNMSFGNKRQSARMSTGGKAPRHSLASKNAVSPLIGREIPTEKNCTGDWDHLIPKKKAPSPEWKTPKETVEKDLMERLGKAAGAFEQAYNLMMRIIGELEDNYEEKKKKEWWAEYEKKGE